MPFTCLDVATAAGLEPGRPRGAEQPFRCPNHDDHSPSLFINATRDVWMCGPCQARGTAYQLAAFLCGSPPTDKACVNEWLREHGLLNGNSTGAETESAHTISATYSYKDERSVLLYQSVRYTPKRFSRRRPDGAGGWIWNLDGVRLVPYALERLVDRTPDLFAPEGEKDVEACWSRGLAATCNIGGAGKWRDDYSRILVMAAGVERAYIVPDHDVPGHQHAAAVAASLHAAGVVVRVVMLPELHDGPPAASHGRDLSDWFATHSGAELQQHAATAPIWTPTTEPPPAIPSHWQRLDLAELRDWRVDPLQPIVDGVFARGNLVQLAAQTQTGKTLLGAYLFCACLHGGRLFDKYAITPVDRALYLVLEDPARRIHDRLLDFAREFPDPIAADRGVFYVAPGFSLTDEKLWPWMETLIRDERRDLVFLDTYQKATPGLSSFDDEAQSKILHRLADLTRRTGVTLVIVDHVRKQSTGGRRRTDVLTLDDIKGTGGKAQNADAVILLERSADKRTLKLQTFSKDFDVPVRIVLHVSPRGSEDPKFSYAGDLEDLADSQHDRAERRRRSVLEALSDTWISSSELASRLGISERTVRRDLTSLLTQKLAEDNGLTKRLRRYRRRTNQTANESAN
jgi:DNA-binding transcriptional ArsR family regulator